MLDKCETKGLRAGLQVMLEATTTEKILQTSLESYLTRMHEHIFVIVKIKAAVLAHQKVLDPSFDAPILQEQKNYNQIYHAILVDTIASAKNVRDISGAFGFVVSLIESSVQSVILASVAKKNIATTIASRESEETLSGKTELERQYSEVMTHEKDMDELLELMLTQITQIESDPEKRQKAVNLAMVAYQESFKFTGGIKNDVKNALHSIEQLLKSGSSEFNELPLDLMSGHLLRGTKSAKVLGPLDHLRAQIAHRFRKRGAFNAYTCSLYVKLSTEEPHHLPTRYEMSCLTAIPKRYQLTDFDPGKEDYQRLKKQLQQTLPLIGKKNRTIYDDVKLFMPSILCAVDKEALSSKQLNQLLPINLRFFSNNAYIRFALPRD